MSSPKTAPGPNPEQPLAGPVERAPERTKRCAKCKKTKPHGAFNKHAGKKDGMDAWCKLCSRADDRKRNQNLERKARRLIARRQAAAKKKGLDVSGLIEHRDDLVKIIVGGQSIMSGIPFNHRGGRSWNSPSIDQKAAGKGYPWENIRVVLDAENSGMGDWGKERAMHVWAHVMLVEAYKRKEPALIEHVLAVVKAFEIKEEQNATS